MIQVSHEFYEAAHELYSACAEFVNVRNSQAYLRIDEAMREFAEASNAQEPIKEAKPD